MRFRSDLTGGQESDDYEPLQVPVEKIKDQWRSLWRNRIDDKVRAEGIADKDFSLLFVDRGTVIVATKDFKPLNLKEIFREHGLKNLEKFRSPPSSEGGYRKFGKTVLNKQSRARKWKATQSNRQGKRGKRQQKKNGGRGWLHYSLSK